MYKKLLAPLLFCSLFYFSCNPIEQPDDDTAADPFAALNLPESYFNYENINLPKHYLENGFPDQFQFQHAALEYDNTPEENPITDAGATLGRVLFYDKRLSANGTVACASCHIQAHGFSDPEVFSIGFNGGLTGRHSMALANARFYFGGKFFWDERAASLEEQVLMPFQDEVEMGLTLAELIQLVESQAHYAPLFMDAFGEETITTDKISKALAQFIRSIVSTSSKYDQARAEVQSPIVDFPSFSDQENMGKDLFFLPQALTNGNMANCAGCHVTEAFSGPIPNNGSMLTTNSTNNGLDLISTDDLGIFESTGNPNDIGKFKSPSLINIAIRSPYMHDGRFESLEEVIEHYSSGIQNHQSMIQPLVNDDGEIGQFNFNAQEKAALKAFLLTLTDEEMLVDEKYSDPFK